MNEKNSECRYTHFLHDYQIVEEFPHGVMEECTRCHDKQFFRNDVKNIDYLSYHLRSILRSNDPRYLREYETI